MTTIAIKPVNVTVVGENVSCRMSVYGDKYRGNCNVCVWLINTILSIIT